MAILFITAIQTGDKKDKRPKISKTQTILVTKKI